MNAEAVQALAKYMSDEALTVIAAHLQVATASRDETATDDVRLFGNAIVAHLGVKKFNRLADKVGI